ncbi:hypothetical protein [Candidatus Amarobacter glycogenicus]|uniref:DUF7282 domain-containing protein n=1 Tax=Candidatus Amarobacter glycogenicus TaxID=3140699 RepID=UPI002A0B9F64|nr:hypothetical protein [Dehalococcoidia bacterium]
MEEVLGFSAVAPGTTPDVEVTIDPLAATDRLTAMLHVDAGTEGEFEFPGVDEPLRGDTAVISQSLAIIRDMQLPAITAADQDISEDGLVRIEIVTLTNPGWVGHPRADDQGRLVRFGLYVCGRWRNGRRGGIFPATGHAGFTRHAA